jgi:hypothetical protein
VTERESLAVWHLVFRAAFWRYFLVWRYGYCDSSCCRQSRLTADFGYQCYSSVFESRVLPRLVEVVPSASADLTHSSVEVRDYGLAPQYSRDKLQQGECSRATQGTAGLAAIKLRPAEKSRRVTIYPWYMYKSSV